MVADITSALMILVTGIIGLATAVYSLADIGREREAFGFPVFFHFMLAGVCGAFLTGDIFNMFVWFEVMLISSFALMCLGGERAQMEGAVKYVTLNLVSSSLFLTACGILYAKVGTLNLADLAVRLRELENPGLLNATAMLFLAAFGLKAGVFPLFFWLPASYHTPPVAVSAVFAGLLTKVGVYSLIRVFTLVFPAGTGPAHPVLLAVAVATMATGVLGAVVQYDFRRLLSFHIISQIGYMVLGLALFTPLALAGAVFYIFHHILVKSNLFLVSGLAQRMGGTFDLKKLGGLLAASPALAVLFFIPAMSLGGIPPLSGFFAKFAVVKAALAGDSGFGIWAGVAAAAALVVGLLTLFSMTKIWAEAFWKKAAAGHEPRESALSAREKVLLGAPVAALALLTLAIGFAPQILFGLSERAAAQLLNPEAYIQAVLRGQP
ncbi:MAG: proton-conducting transporter membrane subunit, partial [Terrimicrobiaceae bacterium]|nr:proton-conducting transporter membrane subunit [Terrimicrobiaceae bacterium]